MVPRTRTGHDRSNRRNDADGHRVTRYGISQPTGIALGPDGTLWFTNKGNNSIGRIDPSTRTVTNYTGTGIDHPDRPVLRRVPTATCGSRTTSWPADRHDRPVERRRRELHEWWFLRYRRPDRHYCRARRQHVVHERGQQLNRRDPHQRQRKHLRLGPTEPSPARRAIAAGSERRAVRSPGRGRQFDRPDRHQREHHELHRSGNFVAGRYAAGSRRRVVVRRQRPGRSDHHHRTHRLLQR